MKAQYPKQEGVQKCTSLFMSEISPEQLKKLENVTSFMEKAAVHASLPITEELQSIHETVKQIAEKETPEISFPEVQKVKLEGIELITIKGEKGEPGEKGETGQSITGSDGKNGLDGKNGKDGIDGKDGLDGKDGVDGKNGENGKDGSPDSSEQIIEKINSDESEKKIKREKVEGLDDELKRIEAKIPSGRGGGTSALGVAQAFKYIAHTEQPTGNIDGINLTYTLKNTIWWIAGFTLNGEQVAQLPNFTVSGRTITFSTAIPLAYSGKDFECKYIGT